MRVVIDGANRGLLGRLTAPPTRVRNEEKLLLGEVGQPGKHGIGRSVVSLLPSVECRRQTTCVGNVLTQSETTVHVEWLVIGSGDSEVGVLVDEALSPLFKSLDGFVVPPVCVVTSLVIMPTSRIESWRLIVSRLDILLCWS